MLANDLLIFRAASINYTAGFKAVLMLMDSFSRMTFTIDVQNHSLNHLQKNLEIVLTAHQSHPRTIILDREEAFRAQQFREFLADRGCALKLVPRDRRETFNGLVEGSIGSLKAKIRAALQAAHLDSSFWMFMVAHAGFIKTGSDIMAWDVPLMRNIILQPPPWISFTVLARSVMLGMRRKWMSSCFVVRLDCF